MTLPPRKYSLEREIALPRAKVWELLSHTDHLNRAIGLAPVQYSDALSDEVALARDASARVAGMPLRWKEYPFQWVKDEEYSILRIYESGPLRRFWGGVRLSDATTKLPDGEFSGLPATRLHLFAELTPANLLGAAIIPLVARSMLRKTLKYCQSYIAAHDKGTPDELPDELPQPVISAPVNDTLLERLLQKLGAQSVMASYAARLGQYLRERGDDEVTKVRPYQLAAQWNAERDEVLRLCLHATKQGILNLSWNLMCPNCRVSKSTVGSLSQVTEQVHCDLCGVNFDVNFDRYVELRFAVHPAIRRASDQVYCIAGPYASPHVVVQHLVQQSQSASIEYPAMEEELRLRVLRTNHVVALSPSAADAASTPLPQRGRGEANAVSGGDGLTQLIYRDDGWMQNEVLVSAGTTLHIRNQSARDIWIVLEKVEWDPFAVTAAKVTAMQEFRNMFSSEVLAPGSHVGIESLTLFFSDLRDSTVLYESAGDAPAYGRVRRHFDYLFGWIQKRNGAIVKTIGDAVMAVFYSPEDALRAALDIQKHIARFNATLPEATTIVIKIGLHHGPAIAVNSDDRLDYFGRTVNIAVRVGGVSEGGDVVMSTECFEHAGVPQILQEYSATAENMQARLKGIDEVFDLYRVRL